MKKIISLLLALTCVFTLFSCGDDEVTPIDNFVNVVSSSEPTKIITQTSYVDDENVLRGRYETILYGQDFEMSYSYQNYSVPAAGADPDAFISTYEGLIYYHDGLYSTDGGATWDVGTPDETAMQVKFDLKAVNLKNAIISQDNKTLIVTVDAESAAKILGVNVNCNADGVKITVVHDGKNLRSILVSYSTERATVVSYETSYSYSAVTSPFEETPAPGTDE